MAEQRFRNFATVVYPESAPEDWLEKLTELHVPAFVSPIHDQDINPTGEFKKAHYHVVLMYEGKKSKDQIKAILPLFGGVGCEVVQTLRGYARYLCHLDNPEKYQYNIDEVKQLSGSDYEDCIGLPTDKYKAVREMQSFIIEHDIRYFSDLADYAMSERPDWFRILVNSGTYYIKEYIKSRTYSVLKKEYNNEYV